MTRETWSGEPSTSSQSSLADRWVFDKPAVRGWLASVCAAVGGLAVRLVLDSR